MTAEAQNLEEILGPEPVIEEQNEQVAQPVEQQTEIETSVVEKEVAPIENKQTPEQIVENYKRMAHAERMERKELQEQMKIMQQRFEQMISATNPKEPDPEYNDDPLGATFTKVDKVAQSVEQLKTEAEQRKHADAYQSFVRNVQADEAQFMQKNTDYKDAVTFLQSRRINELQALGYDENTIRGVIAKDAMSLTQHAMQVGESPASFVYGYAKKLGYTTKQVGNIDTIAEGQKVAKSVAGGAAPVSDGSLPQNLAEMTDTEFDALFKQMSKS